MRNQHLLIIVYISLSCVINDAGLINVSGYEGSSVTFSCSYGSGYVDNDKYLCNNDCGHSDVLIKTSQKNKTKYFISDDKIKRVFTVTITDLHLRDAGKYWCGVNKWFKDHYTEVKLHVKKDRCCDTVNKIQGIEKGSVSISCPYDSESVDKLKYICRGNRPSTCLQHPLITSDSTQNGRFRLIDDKKSRIFTVNIFSLTLKDSGSYLCGVHKNSGLDVFSAVALEVKELSCVKSLNISGIVGHPVTFQCPNSTQHHYKKRFFCKAEQHNNCTNTMGNQRKVMLHNISSSCFSVTIPDLETADAGTYYCGSDTQFSHRKIQLTVVFLHTTSYVAPISTAEEFTSLPPSSHVPDVNLIYILPVVIALLLILIFVLLMVLKYHSRTKQVNEVRGNVLNSPDTDVERRINDIYELEEDVVYMNSSTPNMLNHDDNIYNNTLYS